MIGLDTNVLVRYITQDDQFQAKEASRFIEENCSTERPGYVNHIVLCEIVWVLKRCYQTSRKEVLKVIEQILRTEQFRVQEPQVVWLALSEAKNGKADFADYLSVSINKEAGCEQMVTFDRGLKSAKGVTVLLGI